MKEVTEGPDFHPKEGWRDVSCEVLLGAAAYCIANEPFSPNPFELLDRDDPNFTRSWRNDPYGLARRVEALRQIAIPLYKKQQEAAAATRAVKAKKFNEARKSEKAKKSKKAKEAKEAKESEEAEETTNTSNKRKRADDAQK